MPNHDVKRWILFHGRRGNADGYDHSVPSVLENQEKARANRNKLRNLSTILKGAQKHIHSLSVCNAQKPSGLLHFVVELGD